MRNKWNQDKIDHFASAYALAEDLSLVALLFGLANNKSVRGTASKLRSRGHDIIFRT
jgi:hypothetical protein